MITREFLLEEIEALEAEKTRTYQVFLRTDGALLALKNLLSKFDDATSSLDQRSVPSEEHNS